MVLGRDLPGHEDLVVVLPALVAAAAAAAAAPVGAAMRSADVLSRQAPSPASGAGSGSDPLASGDPFVVEYLGCCCSGVGNGGVCVDSHVGVVGAVVGKKYCQLSFLGRNLGRRRRMAIFLEDHTRPALIGISR